MCLGSVRAASAQQSKANGKQMESKSTAHSRADAKCAHQIANCKVRALQSKHRECKLSGLEFRVQGFELRVWGSEIRV